MRRYDIVSGILLILSIINFALAAPVLVQEKGQAYLDAVHIPHDMISVLRKRGPDDIEKMMDELFGTSEKPVESPSDPYASSSSLPPGLEHVPVNGVKVPAPKPTSPPAHPDQSMELSPSPIQYTMPAVHTLSDSESDYEWLYDSDGEPIVRIASPTSTESGSDHEMNGEYVPQPNPNSNTWPSTGPDPDFDWNDWFNSEFPPRLAFPKEFGLAHENQVEYEQRLDPGPSTAPDWKFLEDQSPPKRPKLSSSNEFDQVHEDEVVNEQQPNPGPLTGSHIDWTDLFGSDDPSPLEQPEVSSPKELDQVHEDQMVHAQQPNPGHLTEVDWTDLFGSDDLPPLKQTAPLSSKEFGQVHEDQV